MRLIDADELREQIKELACRGVLYSVNRSPLISLRKAVETIDHAPTIEPVKRGKWDKVPQGYRWWRCTQCNHTINNVGLPRYCECCGAKMGDENYD